MFSLTIGPITGEQIERAITLLTANGLLPGQAGASVAMTTPAAPPPKPAGAMPPMPGGSTPPPPPPAPAPAAAPANAKLEQVLKLMDAYSRAGHQVAGARKVLALLNLSRAQDATEDQLDWLAQAFANTGWAP
jgi:hypothetical protein